MREKVRVRRGNRLVLFLVDASDSMENLSQLSAAKGAVLSLLSAAYVRRDRVGLIAFRDEKAAVLLPPTSSVHLAQEKLKLLSSGGATPFADGLLTAWKTIRRERFKHPNRHTVLVILSDGEANVPIVPGTDLKSEIHALAELVRGEKVRTIFVDTRSSGRHHSEKEESEKAALVGALGAEYKRIARIGAGELIDIVLQVYTGRKAGGLMEQNTNTLVVVWTSADRDVALKMVFMYTLNAKLKGWWENVRFVVWGPSAKLLSEDKELQAKIGEMKEAGLVLEACKACAEQYGVSPALEKMGIDVKYMGQPLTNYLKSGFHVLTF